MKDKTATEIEVWKQIEEIPSKYEVSSNGIIRNSISGKTVSQRKMYKGYMTVMLYFNNKSYHRRVHKLMMEAFYGVSKDKVVNHLDGDRANNILSNLEYVFYRENVCHGKVVKGLTGTTFFKPRDKWQSRILIDGKRRFLGYFDTKEQAHEAYKIALKENGLENKYV